MPQPSPAADDQPQRNQIIPLFTPVPRLADRCNGWKPEVQRAFIEALAETGSVKSACKRVHRADHGAYMLRRHPEAQEFRAAWDAALDIGLRRIEDVAMDRAINGVEVPVYSYGKLVGTRTAYNDRLLMFILRNRAPDRFGGGSSAARGPNAVEQMKLNRLHKQWRKQWDAERRAQEEREEDDSYAEIDAKLDRLHHNWLADMLPRTREAYETYRRIEAEEKGKTWEPIDWPVPWKDDKWDEDEEEMEGE